MWRIHSHAIVVINYYHFGETVDYSQVLLNKIPTNAEDSSTMRLNINSPLSGRKQKDTDIQSPPKKVSVKQIHNTMLYQPCTVHCTYAIVNTSTFLFSLSIYFNRWLGWLPEVKVMYCELHLSLFHMYCIKQRIIDLFFQFM